MRILASKARVTPSTGIKKPTPLSEMSGMLLGCRLMTALLPGMSYPPSEIQQMVDSECTIASMEAENRVLDIWFTTTLPSPMTTDIAGGSKGS